MRKLILAFLPFLMVMTGKGFGASFDTAYPTKPIRLLTTEAGGGNDIFARFIAQGISRSLGRQVIVDNRGGAGGAIAAQLVAKAAPDGYTILFSSAGLWILPLLNSKVAYDPVRDFAPVNLAVGSPNMIVVHPSMPAKSVSELIALAKANPGKLSYAAGGTGGGSHLAAELFKANAGVNILRVSFRGAAPALNALVSGELDLMFALASSGMPFVKSGRLRALAVASLKPSALAPGLPTVAASGLPGFEAVSVFGIVAPAKTPPTLFNRLNQEIAQFLDLKESRTRLLAIGGEPISMAPKEFAAYVRSDMIKWAKVINDSGIGTGSNR